MSGLTKNYEHSGNRIYGLMIIKKCMYVLLHNWAALLFMEILCMYSMHSYYIYILAKHEVPHVIADSLDDWGPYINRSRNMKERNQRTKMGSLKESDQLQRDRDWDQCTVRQWDFYIELLTSHYFSVHLSKISAGIVSFGTWLRPHRLLKLLGLRRCCTDRIDIE